MAKKVHTNKKVVAKLSTLKKKAWNLLSECVRREAADRNGYVRCYTCGALSQWNRGMQAGHAIGGRSNAVLFDEEIIKVQCIHCNIFLKGNYGIFAMKLIKEHGQEWYEKKQSDSHRVIKWTAYDMKERINEYEKRLEQLDRRKAA